MSYPPNSCPDRLLPVHVALRPCLPICVVFGMQRMAGRVFLRSLEAKGRERARNPGLRAKVDSDRRVRALSGIYGGPITVSRAPITLYIGISSTGEDYVALAYLPWL